MFRSSDTYVGCKILLLPIQCVWVGPDRKCTSSSLADFLNVKKRLPSLFETRSCQVKCGAISSQVVQLKHSEFKHLYPIHSSSPEENICQSTKKRNIGIIGRKLRFRTRRAPPLWFRPNISPSETVVIESNKQCYLDFWLISIDNVDPNSRPKWILSNLSTTVTRKSWPSWTPPRGITLV